jgi:hypothetical protein
MVFLLFSSSERSASRITSPLPLATTFDGTMTGGWEGRGLGLELPNPEA